MPAIDVFIRFLGGGFKHPLRAGDQLEIWSNRAELCGTVDAAMLLDLLAVYLRSAELTKRLAEAVTGPVAVERTTFTLPEPEPPRKPLAPPLRGTFPAERKAELREKRRARRKDRRITMRIASLALLSLFLAGCASTAAVQNRPTAPRADVASTQLTSDQAACEKTAQETRPSHTLAILGGGFLMGAAVSNSDYEELYVQCMKAKGYAFTEGTGK